MLPIFILLFIAIPIIEIYFLIKIGSVIGIGPTLLVVIGTAILGAYLLKQQGLATLARAQQSLGQNSLPAIEMIEAMILLISAAFLLTPGFFTDAIGFACLIPAIRQGLAKRLIKHFQLIHPADLNVNPDLKDDPNADFKADFRADPRDRPEPRTIEAEYWKDE